jgi:sugar phosphate isomerase/epimerase
MSTHEIDRRVFLGFGCAGTVGLGMAGLLAGAPVSAFASEGGVKGAADKKTPSEFQIACMTLPYSQYPFERALTGLKEVGYRFIAWGTSHKEADGKSSPLLALDAPPEKAKELGQRCRDLGLEPVMMFAPPAAPEKPDTLKQRVRQAAAAGIGQVLVFGHTKGNDAKVWVRNLKEVGPVARDKGVIVVLKQHGGNTGTGAALAKIVREVNDDGIKINYDAGNVMDYNKIDPLPDIRECADEVRSFCIKDHRLFPKDEDCGPGFGEIDHYKLLAPVAFTGRVMPLCCENIFAPVIPRPTKPEGIDALAKRAREFLEVVVAGLRNSK